MEVGMSFNCQTMAANCHRLRFDMIFMALKEIRETLDTFPSYSFRDRTSGAMYAGVPTVDLG